MLKNSLIWGDVIQELWPKGLDNESLLLIFLSETIRLLWILCFVIVAHFLNIIVVLDNDYKLTELLIYVQFI